MIKSMSMILQNKNAVIDATSDSLGGVIDKAFVKASVIAFEFSGESLRSFSDIS